MTREEWKERITACCIDAETYKEVFDDVIDTLAGILEKRDIAEELFADGGREVVLERIDRNGANVIKRNPLLVVINEYNTQALAYWRDLGLTPSGLRKLKDNALSERKTGLAEALNEIVQGHCS